MPTVGRSRWGDEESDIQDEWKYDLDALAYEEPEQGSNAQWRQDREQQLPGNDSVG